MAIRCLVPLLLVLLLPSRAAAHAGNFDANVVHACVSNSSQLARIVGVNGNCISSPASKAETPAHWHIQGPQGEQGAEGPVGPQGPVGPSGALALGGISCEPGKAVVGFDLGGLPLCDVLPGGSGGGGDDADGDGIPDALDLCPAIANPPINGVSYCPVTTYAINAGAVPVGAGARLDNVYVENVDGTSMTVSIREGDPTFEGPTGSTLSVNIGPLPAPPTGSRIQLHGLVTAGPGMFATTIVVLSLP